LSGELGGFQFAFDFSVDVTTAWAREAPVPPAAFATPPTPKSRSVADKAAAPTIKRSFG